MIIEKLIKPEKGYGCTIIPYIENEKIIVPAGNYTAEDIEKVALNTPVEVIIPTASEDRVYEIWLTKNGIAVIYVPVLNWHIGDFKNNKGEVVESNVLFYTRTAEFGDIVDPIDKIAWLVVPANQSLSQSTMFVLKVEVA